MKASDNLSESETPIRKNNKKQFQGNADAFSCINEQFDALDIPSFERILKEKGTEVKRQQTTILQLNIGLYCNQACSHCHVESSPLRTEMMSQQVAEQCLRLLDNSPSIDTLDLTGGAPELNQCFRFLVREGRRRNLRVIDRCNLTVLFERGQEDLGEFLREQQVNVVASLPCYAQQNVDQQRGSGVFGKSIGALQYLNRYGYGSAEHPELRLDLVYNPAGPFLPPAQQALEQQYKEKLKQDFDISFNGLYTITNMPIKRYADYLLRNDQLKEYMDLLVQSFNPAAAAGVMCTNTLSVMWDGTLYDCDFNQQLGIGLAHNQQAMSVFDIRSADDLQQRGIAFGRHCFGCTAGAGSSCQGATA